jgi:hypothetical protein
MTKSFKRTVKERLERDPEFRAALLAEAEREIQFGDQEAGKMVLRDYFDETEPNPPPSPP